MVQLPSSSTIPRQALVKVGDEVARGQLTDGSADLDDLFEYGTRWYRSTSLETSKIYDFRERAYLATP